jgi:hypothetical protein
MKKIKFLKSIIETLGWFCVMVVFLFSLRASGETLVFSPEAPLTLEQVIKSMKPGDTLLLNPGHYFLPEGVTISNGHNGRLDKPITLKGKDPEKVILDGRQQAVVVLRIEGDYWNVENLTIKDGKEYGILLKGSHLRVKNNVFFGSGEDAIKSIFKANELEISHNRVFNPGREGIDIFGTIGAKIHGNIIKSAGGCGIFAKGGARNISIEGNTVIHARQGGIYIGGMSDFLSDGETHECTGCRAVSNLVVQSGAHGVFALGCRDGLIAHNTIIGTSSWYGAPLGSGHGGESKTIGRIPSKNIKIFNNIVAYPKSRVYLQVEKDSEGDFYSDYNLFFGLPNPRFDWRGISHPWEEFKKTTKNEVHTLLQDPQFEDLTGDNYSLRAQSPAKKAGLSIDQSLENDIRGQKRRLSQPTLGAWE